MRFLNFGLLIDRSTFWKRFPGLVWSNPNAPDEVFIRAALCQPRFEEILAITAEFGLDKVKEEWAVLKEEGTEEARRASQIVERIIRNIEKGAKLARTQYF